MNREDIPKLKTGDLLDRDDGYWIFLYSTPGDDWITAFNIGHSWFNEKRKIRHYVLYNDTKNLGIAGIYIGTIDKFMSDEAKQKLFDKVPPTHNFKIKRYAIQKFFKHFS